MQKFSTKKIYVVVSGKGTNLNVVGDNSECSRKHQIYYFSIDTYIMKPKSQNSTSNPNLLLSSHLSKATDLQNKQSNTKLSLTNNAKSKFRLNNLSQKMAIVWRFYLFFQIYPGDGTKCYFKYGIKYKFAMEKIGRAHV